MPRTVVFFNPSSSFHEVGSQRGTVLSSDLPKISSGVELSGRHASGLLNLIGVGKALPREGVAAKEPPPALLQIEPARSFGEEKALSLSNAVRPHPALHAM